ncbi:hypothetical protein C1I93_19195 [Micromonospora endophytica]|uniref:Uncharacterized protein n=1 Tax=Micromonospora endophytica TaxID=515350 RepID=A0A2W2CI06_9ACTN|nr:hypothetical protein C1I93_19195 [Micromonospora endophytica]RIW42576.1 hypothetical protein D3H59_22930 [Micromonospora endophytica]BCJ57490.1 hypothetical protein Jiend_09120 [Micromonospora endophytica]
MPALLAAARGHLRVATPAASDGAVTRSHLADGRCVGWYAPPPPGWRVAIDAEHRGAAPPSALVRRFGAADFWPRWTRAECLAKLADVPMVTWWHRYGLAVPPGTGWLWRTLYLDDLVVTAALAPATSVTGWVPRRRRTR